MLLARATPCLLLCGAALVKTIRFRKPSYIYTHDTVRWALTGGKAPSEHAPVRIGDCSYIGSQSVIAKGVNIGDHAVVGACSFMNANIPSWSIAVGAPCRVIGRVVLEGDSVRLEYGS